MPIAPGYIPIYNDKGVVIGSRKPDGSFSSAMAKQWFEKHGSSNPAKATKPTPGPANGALGLGTGFVAIYGPNGELLGARKPDGSYTTPAAEQADLKTEPVKPFLTPDQSGAQIQGDRDYKLGELDIDEGLDRMRADTTYEKTLIDRGLLRDTNQTVDAMIARGLMQSSIKDSAIWDITQTATIRKTQLDTALSLAEQYGIKRKDIAGRAHAALYSDTNPDSVVSKQKIQNADEANRTLVPSPRVATPYTKPRSPAAPAAKKVDVPTVDKLTGGVRAPDEW